MSGCGNKPDMMITVDYYATLTYNDDNDLGDPDLTEYSGPFVVDADPDAYSVAASLEKTYGHPIGSVGVSWLDFRPV